MWVSEKRTHQFFEFTESVVLTRGLRCYVQIVTSLMYSSPMEVAISELRAHLSDWLERARGGSEIVVTDRGIPVARLLGVEASETLQRLTAEGLVAPPSSVDRPRAKGRRRAKAAVSVADLVGEQRR